MQICSCKAILHLKKTFKSVRLMDYLYGTFLSCLDRNGVTISSVGGAVTKWSINLTITLSLNAICLLSILAALIGLSTGWLDVSHLLH